MHLPFEMVVEPEPDAFARYRVRWCDGEPDGVFGSDIPECWLDLVPYMVARKLFEHGNHPERMLVIKLRGADFELCRAPLGVMAATPRMNTEPVTEPTRCLYRNWAGAP